jgi:hypothetical protein
MVRRWDGRSSLVVMPDLQFNQRDAAESILSWLDLQCCGGTNG